MDIAQIIEQILDRLNHPYSDVEECESELPEHRKYVIHTDNTGILIGKDGKHLHALRVLVRKIVHSNLEEDEAPPRFFIDVGDYESQKIKEIQRIAYMMAGRAKTFERNVEMDPMSSYERMIVHQTLAPMDGVKTKSDGRGSSRHVVIHFTQS